MVKVFRPPPCLPVKKECERTGGDQGHPPRTHGKRLRLYHQDVLEQHCMKYYQTGYPGYNLVQVWLGGKGQSSSGPVERFGPLNSPYARIVGMER